MFDKEENGVLAKDLDPQTVIIMEIRSMKYRLSRLESVVFGFCGLILIAVVGTWIKLSIK